jgi:hypothetical protein
VTPDCLLIADDDDDAFFSHKRSLSSQDTLFWLMNYEYDVAEYENS